MVNVPAVGKDTVTLQLADAPVPASVQMFGRGDQSTVPVGVTVVPIPEESVTVAVHIVAVLIVTWLGEQFTVVVVARALTVMFVPPLLGACAGSPG